MLSTPQRIHKGIRKLCRQIPNVDDPIFVEVEASPKSNLNDCFANVAAHIEEFGGSIQHGWTLWEWPNVFAEAEFHAVWKRPDGILIDITKKRDLEKRILFASDPRRVFNGQRVDNIRLALGTNPKIGQLLRMQESHHRRRKQLMGDSIGKEVVLKGKDYDLCKQMGQLEVELFQLYGPGDQK